jgi:uncharacterized membrane protein
MTAIPGRIQRSGQPERPGRPLHPPLTDFPVAAYVFAAVFDVISAAGGDRHSWARQFWHAGTFVLIAGASICILTVLTGFRDLLKYYSPGSEAVRSISIHVCVMIAVYMVGVGDIAWRLKDYSSSASTPAGILVLSLVAAAGVGVGAAYGGALVFRHGTGVAVAGARAVAGAADTVAGAADTRAGAADTGASAARASAARAEARSGAAGAEPRPAGQVPAPSAAATDMALQAARHRLRRGK